MALKTALASQIGFKAETTYGVPDVGSMTFLPLVSSSLGQEIDPLLDASIIAGRRVMTSEQDDLGGIKVGGDVGLELYNKNLRPIFKQMFGAESGSGPYTYTPGDLDDDSFTTQVGIPDLGGTVRPFTYAGCKVASWEIAVKKGEKATLGLTLAAQREFDHRTVADGVTTNGSAAITSATAAFGPDDVGKPISGTGIAAATTILSVQSATAATLSANATASGSGIAFTIGVALASASYTSGLKVFRYYDAVITIAGAEYKVREATIGGDNMLIADREQLGQRYVDQPLEGTDTRNYSGTLDSEFVSPVAYRRFLNGTEAALVVTLSNGTQSIVITQNVKFGGKTPGIDGKGIVGQTLPYVARATSGGGADSTAITAVLSDA